MECTVPLSIAASQDVLSNADILYDKSAVLNDTIKRTACAINLIPKCQVTVISSAVMGCTLKERALVAERFLL
jgi:hypothetical protein